MHKKINPCNLVFRNPVRADLDTESRLVGQRRWDVIAVLDRLELASETTDRRGGSRKHSVRQNHPMNQSDQSYQMIEMAIGYLRQHHRDQPSLDQLAEVAGVTKFHLQRTFKKWAGVSPKQFVKYLTKEHAKNLLRQRTILDVAFDVGLSGPSRLHDLFVTEEGVTPGEYRGFGKGLTIEYGSVPTRFGWCHIATTCRGVCKLAFYGQQDEPTFLQELSENWSGAKLRHNRQTATQVVNQTFGDDPVQILLKGSPFQLKVWEALLSIPEGELRTYHDIAVAIDQPKSFRAVATAIGKNEVAMLIPCHRVIRAGGTFGEYRWGTDRKAAMIGWECCNGDH